MLLQNKTIWILSPQSWGKMFISKHHYAISLAKKGNQVYFFNPPNDPSPVEQVSVKASGVHKNLWIVDHRIYFPYSLKFHALPLYHWLIQWHIKKKLLKEISHPDIVWSFDIGYLYPLKYFPSTALKIFHPVDDPVDKISIDAASGADIIFSVTGEILDKYKKILVPRHWINHGLSSEFLEGNPEFSSYNNGIKVGFSGNLLRNDLDREILLEIVSANPTVRFEFWGAYRLIDSNIGGAGDGTQLKFIEKLQSYSNAILHGAVGVKQLAGKLGEMDAFLICYDVKKDQSRGTNYHKIMEFLSTGKVVVSNNVTAYKNLPELVTMIADRESNKDLPGLFKTVMDNIRHYNNSEWQQKRKDFARENTYDAQVDRIESYLKLIQKVPK